MPKFDLDEFCKITQDHKITMAYLVPPIILRLAKEPLVSKYDLSSILMINSGAAPLTKELVEALYERLHIPVKQGYGLSETSPTTHNQVSPHRKPMLEATKLIILAMGHMEDTHWLRGHPSRQPNCQVYVSGRARGQGR